MDKTLTFQLEKDLNGVKAVQWVLEVFGQYTGVSIVFSNSEEAIKVGYSKENKLILDHFFWTTVDKQLFSEFKCLNNHLMVESTESNVDELGTAFYFLNCLWERSEKQNLDSWGRNKFSDSVWAERGLDSPFCHVNNVFDTLIEKLNIKVKKREKKVFLSHDIDAVYSGWKEDGLAYLKKKNFKKVLEISAERLKGNHRWFNFDLISNLESKYGCTSTFYWLVTNKKVTGIGKNADYNLQSKQLKSIVKKLSKKGFSHGIHKSIAASSLKEELNHFPFEIDSNRYHYLKYKFSNLIEEVNDSGLKMDASLGYAEVSGFRNGYSYPFSPFDFKTNAKANFIEVPLTIMDATMSRYKGLSQKEATAYIINEMHKTEHGVISVLWHNSHFSEGKYSGYLAVYEYLLNWMKDNRVKSISPKALIEKYG